MLGASELLDESLNVALDIFGIIDEFIKKKIKKDEVAQKFRARTRQMPARITRDGLANSILFLYSKIGRHYHDLVNILEGKHTEKNSVEKIKDVNSENIAYGLYLYTIVKALDMLGYEYPSITRLMYELTDELKSLMYEEQLMDILLYIKRLAEAVYKEE